MTKSLQIFQQSFRTSKRLFRIFKYSFLKVDMTKLGDVEKKSNKSLNYSYEIQNLYSRFLFFYVKIKYRVL